VYFCVGRVVCAKADDAILTQGFQVTEKLVAQSLQNALCSSFLLRSFIALYWLFFVYLRLWWFIFFLYNGDSWSESNKDG